MWKKNNGKGESNIIQNRFTRYVITSIRRAKAGFLSAQAKVEHNEAAPILGDTVPEGNQINQLIDLIALAQILDQFSKKERYIFLARTLDGRDFKELAAELGMTYKGIYSIYYRMLREIKHLLGR